MNNSTQKSSDRFKIILFLCNWSPHAAYQTLQDRGLDIPAEIKMIRAPCTGRITKSLLFKAFEKGADGVALVGCKSGTCRYGSGTTNAQNNTRDIRQILDIVGLDKERMRMATFHPDQSQPLLQFLMDFCSEIQTLGHTPIKTGHKTDLMPFLNSEISEIVSKHDVFSCQDCGKCTSACSLALSGKPFSPRAVAAAIIAGDSHSASVQEDIWSCLTCGICYDRCPSAVNFPEFIRDIRGVFKKSALEGHQSHGGFFHSLMRAMTSQELKTRRWETLPEEIEIDPESKILFFGGCAPYFDIFFRENLKVQTGNILIDSLRLLNFFDIRPAILEDERCCGHDLLWSGDGKNFLKLAQMNVDAIHRRGIEEVVTACPECYRTLAYDYPRQGLQLNFKVTHIYDLLEREIGKGAVDFKRMDKKLTYQDACRLSRFEQRPDLPRRLLQRLKSAGFVEMKDSGTSAICCGNSAWTGCDAYSKALQVKRLKQARETGSDVLVTSCPKCQIHLRCAMRDPFQEDELKIEMMDLVSVLARTICWE